MFGWISELRMLRRVNKELRDEVGDLREKLEREEATNDSLRKRLLVLITTAQDGPGMSVEPMADQFVRKRFGVPPVLYVPVNAYGHPINAKPDETFTDAYRSSWHNTVHIRVIKYCFAGVMDKPTED